MYKPMRFHSSCYTNTQRTFTTNTRLITTSCWVKCMSNYHFGWISSDKHISLRKSTNITARCKSMWFELVKTSKLVGTVSTLLHLSNAKDVHHKHRCQTHDICMVSLPCDLSPMWTVMWLFRSADRLNALSHTWHLCGFSPVWTLMWRFRSVDWLNALSHMWHLCGFSPVWTLMWWFRLPDWLNAMSHM